MLLQIEIRGYDDPDVTAMVSEVQAEYVQMYGGPDAAAVDPSQFAPPDGLLLVGLLDGAPVATGAWRRVAPLSEGAGATAEIKRMYVRSAARRQGLARQLLAELERTAARAGVESLVLNTGPRQTAAIQLYLQFGYEVVPGFGHYAHLGDALFYGKSLRPGGAAPPVTPLG